MAHVVLNPTDTQTIAAAPLDIRTELEKVANDQVTNAGMLNGLVSGNASGQIPVSNGTINTNLNAEKLGGQPISYFSPATHVHGVATGSSNGFMANTDFTKLSGIAALAEVNQNAWSNILVGGVTLQADTKTDTFELIPGANIALTPNATNDTITLAVTGTVPLAASAAACTGNSATATTATTAGACTGNSATATKLATPRAINGVNFDGSAAITITAAANGGTAAYLSNFSVGLRSSADLNTYLTSGTIALNSTPVNIPGGSYLAGFVANNSDVGLQIVGGYNSDALWFRGWWSSGTTFSAWRSVIHSGNIGSQSVNYAASANYATSAGSAPANGGISTYGNGLRRMDASDNYSVKTNWTGTYWELKGYLPDSNTVHAGCKVSYADNAGGVPWSGVSGAPAIPASYDTAHSFTASGYQKFSNGLLIQWGTVPTVYTFQQISVNFPIAFPNACLAANSTVTTAGTDNSMGVTAMTKTSATFIANKGSENVNITGVYIAIGY